MQFEREIPDNPEEGWEELRNLVRVALSSNGSGAYLDLVAQVNDQGQILKCVFVNCAHRVVDEVAGKQEGQ